MTKYVVFLRGINVGGRIVKMADLKTCLESIGLAEVKTLLQSGNVIFETDKPEDTLKKSIETKLTSTFSYPTVQVLTLARLKTIVNDYPYKEAVATQHDYVIFLENGLEMSLEREEYSLSPNEKVMPGKGVIYWRVDKGQTLQSSFAKLLAKPKYRDFNTNRNLNTLKKLISL